MQNFRKHEGYKTDENYAKSRQNVNIWNMLSENMWWNVLKWKLATMWNTWAESIQT